jgi:hypothetical protein
MAELLFPEFGCERIQIEAKTKKWASRVAEGLYVIQARSAKSTCNLWVLAGNHYTSGRRLACLGFDTLFIAHRVTPRYTSAESLIF